VNIADALSLHANEYGYLTLSGPPRK